ncbi:ubiquitin-associated protein 1-like [Periophthalmus magnuspinnatus]|uniref:ubiquitin-associated protein 1-like n=1 Tax=Periophthalmus magnuspinnatus TaxID=409849 RepID=UPI00145AEF7B|nr:ubiquitin-associated protein 1-like [Periophthalmus magnuspinnatus]
MEGVPLKMPEYSSQEELVEDVQVTVPDYLTILQETEYDFSLEKWVLTGLQNGFMKLHHPSASSSSSSSLQPTCPPYWMMFRSPQQSRLASRHSSDFWEPNPRQRSYSLNPSVLRAKFTISDSEDESENVETVNIPLPEKKDLNVDMPCTITQRNQKKAQKAFVPDLLHPPTCLSSLPHQRRKNLRQCSLSVLETTKQNAVNEQSTPKGFSRSDSVDKLCSQKLGKESISPHSCPEPSVAPRPLGLSSAACDSSIELLSALSLEERELLGVITARGYPLRTAFIALQKTGRQAPEKILNYLVACDHLCQLGYDILQVEEALEMFQNCETKAEEFLHLLSQFNEMGFQQNAIKEVLLVHENHRERALEELMMRVA